MHGQVHDISRSLRFLTEPKVQSAPRGIGVNGLFYVSGLAILDETGPHAYYLHTDGTWGRTTRDGNRLLAYYDTRALALLALAKQVIEHHPRFDDTLTLAEAKRRHDAIQSRRET